MAIYNTYEEMLEANIESCDFSNVDDVIQLCDWLLGEAYKKEKLLQLLTKRAEEVHNIDLYDLVTFKDLNEIPNASLKPWEDICNEEDLDEYDCENCKCIDCPYYEGNDGNNDTENLVSKILNVLSKDEDNKKALHELLKTLNTTVDENKESD